MGVIAANSTDRQARQVSFLIGVRSTLIWSIKLTLEEYWDMTTLMGFITGITWEKSKLLHL